MNNQPEQTAQTQTDGAVGSTDKLEAPTQTQSDNAQTQNGNAKAWIAFLSGLYPTPSDLMRDLESGGYCAHFLGQMSPERNPRLKTMLAQWQQIGRPDVEWRVIEEAAECS